MLVEGRKDYIARGWAEALRDSERQKGKMRTAESAALRLYRFASQTMVTEIMGTLGFTSSSQAGMGNTFSQLPWQDEGALGIYSTPIWQP